MSASTTTTNGTTTNGKSHANGASRVGTREDFDDVTGEDRIDSLASDARKRAARVIVVLADLEKSVSDGNPNKYRLFDRARFEMSTVRDLLLELRRTRKAAAKEAEPSKRGSKREGK